VSDVNRIEGLHHVAVCTANLKAQIAYFTDVLGMELVALYWMHGVTNTWHAFLRMGEASIAFLQNPDIEKIPIEIGRTHSGNPAASCARGTMQHLSLRVRDELELLAMRDRIRSRGVPVLGPLDHGLCKSIYFAGPENLSLEIACSSEPINPKAWIDPKVATLAGISPAELESYLRPVAFHDRGGAVPQPPLDGPGPHMTNYPEGFYEALLSLPDEDVLAMSEKEPPVQVG
jgi:catechol 2,3-dioxygenase-like lactoylglutathione lyase family enzyme